MTREQEEKFKAWYMAWPFAAKDKKQLKDTWAACLEANGIGETPTESASPQWVIEMIRTGKPVVCKVWDDDPADVEVVTINGYRMDGPYLYRDNNGTWYSNAEPIPAWVPKDGEAVLTRVFDHAETGYVKGGFVYVRNNRLAIEGAEFKPFDESKIGWLWSEI